MPQQTGDQDIGIEDNDVRHDLLLVQEFINQLFTLIFA